MEIPIVDSLGRVVGWTTIPPEVRAGRLTHETAAALIGPDLSSANVELTNPEHARRAGAPNGWREAWRCLAICPPESGAPFGFEPSMGSYRPRR